MNNLKIYCVTNKKLSFLEKTSMKLVGVGKEEFSNNYLKCDTKINIYHKEKYYSELTFHYWYWKNILPSEKKEMGWLLSKEKILDTAWYRKKISQENLEKNLLTEISDEFDSYESFNM